MPSLKKSIGRLAGWTLISTVVAALLQICQLAVIARLLGAPAVAVVAIFNIFLTVSSLLQDFGLSGYFVHRQVTSPSEDKTLFLLSLGLGSLLAAVLWMGAPVAASFYGEPVLGDLFFTLAGNTLLVAVWVQFQALALREMRIDFLAKAEILSRLLGFTMLIVLLLVGVGVIAVGIALLTTSAAKGAMLVTQNAQHIGRLRQGEWKLGVTSRALRYGSYQIGAQLINQLRVNADVLIFGRVLGLAEAGVYAMAKELVIKPARILQPVISRITLPLFARLQDDPVEQSQMFLQAIVWSSRLNAVIYASLMALAAPVVQVLYGGNYQIVAVLISPLCLFAFLRTLGTSSGTLAQANARTALDFGWNIVAAGLTAGFLFIVTSYPLLYIVIAIAIFQLGLTILSYFMLVRPLTGVSFSQFLRPWAGIALLMALLIGISVHEEARLNAWLILVVSGFVVVQLHSVLREYKNVRHIQIH